METSVTVNFSNFSNFSGNEVFFPMLFNQLKNGFLWNSNFWKIIFYAFQILKRKFLCFSPTWKSYFMVFSLHFRVLNLYFLGFFLTASASSTEKRKWLLHMSLFKYSLVVKCWPQFSQEKRKWLLHMSIFRHLLIVKC